MLRAFAVFFLLVVLCGLFSNVAGFALQQEQDQAACELPEVRRELLRRQEADQMARRQVSSNDTPQELIDQIVAIDRENREWLSQIIDEHGFPGKRLAGRDGASAAWLIVQHADQDLPFQRRCLDLIHALPDGEVDPVNIAYLTDRVLVNEGKPQRYATQMTMRDGKLAFQDLEDPDNVDARRAEVGLPPAAEYLRQSAITFGLEQPVYDHHVHVLSPRLLEDWKSLGMEFSRDDEQYTEIGQVLQCTGADRIVAVSMAYLYGSEWFDEVTGNEAAEIEAVRAENDYIARCVANSRGRSVGFFSVNPLSGYAIEEIRRCEGDARLSGLKLHFPASGVDIADDEHLEKLRAVFRLCSENGIPILVHPATADVDSFGTAGASRFWRELVEDDPQLKLIIAHLGASGGIGPNSIALMNGYLELRERKAEFVDAGIYFDLSGAVLAHELDGLPATTDEQCLALAETMREIGLDRFLPASDYPAINPDEMRQTLLERLPLGDSEFERLRSNSAPFIDVHFTWASR
ncbi:MAG: DUF6624 domain-containing protein [Planctomycetota bacterium]